MYLFLTWKTVIYNEETLNPVDALNQAIIDEKATTTIWN